MLPHCRLGGAAAWLQIKEIRAPPFHHETSGHAFQSDGTKKPGIAPGFRMFRLRAFSSSSG